MFEDYAASDELSLLCIDLDGTLLNRYGAPTEGARDALASASQRGDVIVFATARNWLTTAPALVALGSFPTHIICSDGAVIMERQSGQEDPQSVDECRKQYSPCWTMGFAVSNVLRELREQFPRALIMAELPDGTLHYAGDFAGLVPAHASLTDYRSLVERNATRLFAISADLSDGSRVPPWEPRFLGIDDVAGATGLAQWVEITPARADKGIALSELDLKVPTLPRRRIAIGDGRNDLGMFAWAQALGGIAVAMGQASNEVRAAADVVTATADEGGFAHALRQLHAC